MHSERGMLYPAANPGKAPNRLSKAWFSCTMKTRCLRGVDGEGRATVVGATVDRRRKAKKNPYDLCIQSLSKQWNPHFFFGRGNQCQLTIRANIFGLDPLRGKERARLRAEIGLWHP